jgi:antitoxin component of MazEF toxin-antitoxin module
LFYPADTVQLSGGTKLMSLKHIARSPDSTAILLPQEVLDEMGVCEGDEVDVSVSDGTLLMRPLNAERARKLEDATKAVFERRGDAYKKLAEGVE